MWVYYMRHKRNIVEDFGTFFADVRSNGVPSEITILCDSGE